MKKYIATLLSVLLAIPTLVFGINISVPSAPSSGYVLVSTSTGAYISVATTSPFLGLGTVTSIGATVPTGLSIAGSPITRAGTLAFTLTSGYVIPLSASTTNWNNFYDTPSSRITAGTNLSWSGNTLNSSGGGSGNSAWTIGNGLIYNATSTDFVGIGSSTPTAKLTVAANGTSTNKSFVLTDSLNVPKFTIQDNGSITATTSNANHTFISNVTGNVSFSTANVLAIRHLGDNGAGAISFQDAAGNERGAVGYKNNSGGATIYNGAVYLAGGAYSPDGSPLGTTTKIIIGQEPSGSPVARQVFESDLTIGFKDTTGTTQTTMNTDGSWGFSKKVTLNTGSGTRLDAFGIGTFGNFSACLSCRDSDSSYALNIQDTGANLLRFVKANVVKADFQINGTGNDKRLEIVDTDNSAVIPISFALNGTANVGIASSTPGARLSVKGTGTGTGLTLQTTNSSNVPTFTVLDNGTVGISTTTPATALDVKGGIVAEEVASSFSATPTFDFSTANQFRMTMTSNVTSITLSNVQPGKGDAIILCQDGTGSRTVAGWDSKVIWAGGTAPTQTATLNKCDLYTFRTTVATGTLRVFGSAVQNF